MHLRSKLRKKHTGILALFFILLLLPFKETIKYTFLSLSRNLLLSRRDYGNYIGQHKTKRLGLLLKARESEYLRQENERLRKALGFKKNKDVNLLGVEVISFDPSSWRRVVVVNAGKAKGLKEGLFAVDEEGWLIGKIIEAGNSYSRLMLIKDADFTLPVFVGRSAFGLLKGGLGVINILYIERSEDIKLKDKVWLKTPLLISPLYIGEVDKIIRDDNKLFLDVKVKLFSRTPLLNKIFIVK